MGYTRTIEIDPALVREWTYYYAGQQGEDSVTLIRVDMSEPSYELAVGGETVVLSAAFKRPDGNAYAITADWELILGKRTGWVEWSPSAVDTEIAGKAQLEITLSVVGQTSKTQLIPLYIGEDIGAVVPESSIDVGDIAFSGVNGTEYLPIGTPGQMLTVNAGATAPEWETYSAADVPIVDAGSIYTATNVETALAEVRTAVDALEASVVGTNVALKDALQQLGPQLTHAHGYITNDGKIGTTPGLVIVTGAGGAVGALAAGTTAQYLRGDGAWASTPVPSNPNILDNWDFRNPINQHGLTTYGDAGVTIDRWTLANSADQVEVKSTLGGHVYITAGADKMGWMQDVAYGYYYAGRELTFSVYVVDKGSANSYITIFDGVSYTSSAAMTDVGLYSVTATLNNAASRCTCIIYTPLGGTVGILCAKLEIGDTSTLGNDSFADVDEQYVICKRYFERLTGAAYCAFASGVGEWTYEDTCTLTLPFSPKRTTPTITFGGGLLLGAISTGTGRIAYFSLDSIAVTAAGPTSAALAAVCTDSSISGSAVVLCQDAGATGYIDISAEM